MCTPGSKRVMWYSSDLFRQVSLALSKSCRCCRCSRNKCLSSLHDKRLMKAFLLKSFFPATTTKCVVAGTFCCHYCWFAQKYVVLFRTLNLETFRAQWFEPRELFSLSDWLWFQLGFSQQSANWMDDLFYWRAITRVTPPIFLAFILPGNSHHCPQWMNDNLYFAINRTVVWMAIASGADLSQETNGTSVAIITY